MGSWATGREGEAPGVGQGQKSGTEVCHWTMAHLDIPWEKQMPDVAFWYLLTNYSCSLEILHMPRKHNLPLPGCEATAANLPSTFEGGSNIRLPE